MAHYHKYYVSGHYPSPCFYLETVLFIFQNTTIQRPDSISVLGKTYSVGPNWWSSSIFSDTYFNKLHTQGGGGGGNLDLADSTAHAMSRFATLFVIAKLGPLLSTDSSHSVRTCSGKLMTRDGG
jgi:hypothetical protein